MEKKKLTILSASAISIALLGIGTYQIATKDGKNISNINVNKNNKIEERINYSDKKNNVVIAEITEDGYVSVHGDHTHLEKGIIPYNAKFLDSTLLKDKNYKLNKDDILYEVAQGYIIKVNGKFFYYPKENVKQTNIVTREEAEKLTKNNDVHEHEHKATNDSNKKKSGVAGIDYPTSDGFLFSSEGQIIGKTANGLIVNHNGHSHVILFEDLKNTKWSYLIPNSSNNVERINNIISSNQNNPNINNNTANESHSDGYVFNPNDVIAEDENGYTVKHGDHYHYIPKNKIKKDVIENINKNNIINNKIIGNDLVPNNNNNNNKPTENINITELTKEKIKFAGIDFPTSDNFLFDGKNIVSYSKNMLLVNHSGHYHPVFYYQIFDSKWKHLIPTEHLKSAEIEYINYLKNIKNKKEYIAKKENIKKEDIKIVDTKKGKALSFLKDNKETTLLLDDIKVENNLDNNNNDTNNEENNEKENFLLGNSDKLSELAKSRVKQIVEKYSKDGVTPEKIKVFEKDNMIIYPHVGHYHSEAIDINKPITGDRPDVYEEPDTDPSIEETTIIGPFEIKNRKELFDRKTLLKNHPEFKDKVKDIHNFRTVGFFINKLKGEKIDSTLKLDGKNVDYVAYLVRKNVSWNETNIKFPELNVEKGFYFKNWSGGIPSDGFVTDRNFYANIRDEKYKNSPSIMGPYGLGLENKKYTEPYHISDYATLSFQIFDNLGYFEQNGKNLRNISYFVRNDMSWKKLTELGLEKPKVIAHNNYEFVEWVNSYEDNINSNAYTTIMIPRFGTTDKIIGTYRLNSKEELNNPYEHGVPGPKGSATSKPYDPNKYILTSFIIDENKGTLFTYLVRKDSTYKELNINPQPFTKTGYRFVGWKNFNENSKVENQIFEPIFEKNTNNENDIFDELVGPVNPNKPIDDIILPGDDTDELDDLIGSTNQSEETRKKIYLAKQLDISELDIETIDTPEGKAFLYPHDDHKHTILIKDIDLSKNISNPEEDKELTEKIKYISETYGVPIEAIEVNDNFFKFNEPSHEYDPSHIHPYLIPRNKLIIPEVTGDAEIDFENELLALSKRTDIPVDKIKIVGNKLAINHGDHDHYINIKSVEGKDLYLKNKLPEIQGGFVAGDLDKNKVLEKVDKLVEAANKLITDKKENRRIIRELENFKNKINTLSTGNSTKGYENMLDIFANKYIYKTISPENIKADDTIVKYNETLKLITETSENILNLFGVNKNVIINSLNYNSKDEHKVEYTNHLIKEINKVYGNTNNIMMYADYFLKNIDNNKVKDNTREEISKSLLDINSKFLNKKESYSLLPILVNNKLKLAIDINNNIENNNPNLNSESYKVIKENKNVVNNLNALIEFSSSRAEKLTLPEKIENVKNIDEYKITYNDSEEKIKYITKLFKIQESDINTVNSEKGTYFNFNYKGNKISILGSNININKPIATLEENKEKFVETLKELGVDDNIINNLSGSDNSSNKPENNNVENEKYSKLATELLSKIDTKLATVNNEDKLNINEHLYFIRLALEDDESNKEDLYNLLVNIDKYINSLNNNNPTVNNN